MSRNLPKPDASMRRNSLDDVRPTALRASLSDQSPSSSSGGGQSSSVRLSSVVKDALLDHYGSLKAAALSMTPPMDQGQLTRELQTGDFKFEKLDRLDSAGKACVAEALHKACGDLDPKAEARRLIREARQRLDALAEHIA